MSLAVVYTRANLGIDAPLVTIEVHLSNGLPAFNLVGLPETTVKESRDRVRSALINSEFEFPSKRITVNMAPADLPKGGSRFDLAIAIGIIKASEQLKNVDLSAYEFVGELALSGELRAIKGALPMAFAAEKSNRQLILPDANAQEAALVRQADVIAANSLMAVYLHLNKKKVLPFVQLLDHHTHRERYGDMADIIGQDHAKRALEIAASGKHNILFFGPAGTGKSMLADRLLSIMPDLDERDALQSACVRSIAGEEINTENWQQRPFRQPHHTCSSAALVGGGTYPKPGEISLAHKGVLFLDELPEYGRHILDVLREPLETGQIHLSRAAFKVTYPCDFQLVCAMNPSPTGDINDNRATPDQVLRYLNRISGPFLDRIDLQVHVPKINLTNMLQEQSDSTDPAKANDGNNSARNSEHFKQAVVQSQKRQLNRQGKLNQYLNNKEIANYCWLSHSNHAFLTAALEHLQLSMRAYHRTLKVARTIADLDDCESIEKLHLAEALGFRSFDQLLQELKA